MKCPICGKKVEPGSPDEPFCSDRCRLIDLANWATGRYRIPEPAASEAEQQEDDERDQHGPDHR